MNDVVWVPGLLSSRPRWVNEPSLELIQQIACEYLRIEVEQCSVTFYAQGGFNKLYEVHTADTAAYLVRVALPVEPRRKTLSEVATINFVREHCGTELIPRIVAYDANAVTNSLGFEWIIMVKLPGTVLDERWSAMSFAAKEHLVKTLVAVLAKLYEHPLHGIGNIYPQDAPPPVVGRIVSMPFFWDKHAKQDVPRGPFKTSADWLSARLTFILNDAAEILRTSDDEDDIEDAEATQSLARRLANLLPTLFPEQAEPELTIIHHDDMSFHNILVDTNGQLTGIVDWECVSALPLWYACQFPSFLNGRMRNQRPDETQYAVDEDGKRELFDEHLREWEQTQLRVVFLNEMQHLQPAWVSEHRRAAVRADFEMAVTHCDGELSRRRINDWVDRIEASFDSKSDHEIVETSLRNDLLQ